jgi:Endonuclease IV (EC 3.1.21.-)
MIIGCHLSVAKGYHHMGKEALSIGANTFQFFTRNPRGGSSKAVDSSDATSLNHLMITHNFGPILAHAPYTLNPCSIDERVRRFAYQVFEEDLKKLEIFPGTYYNFHPGSHVGNGVEKGIAQIVELLNHTMTSEQSTVVLLETMAGKGTEVGSKFEELRAIIEGVEHKDKIGVCLDTCHVYDAGYDIVNNLDNVLAEFDRIIGLDRLKAIHLNDSKNPFESHKDRHEKIGQGYIGDEAIKRIINHPLLRSLPFYLETPNELSGYAEEIKYLKENSIPF